MRSDSSSDMNKQKTKFGTFTKVWSILYVIITAAFVAIAFYMDILPPKYLYIAVGVVAGLTIITLPALFFRKFKKSRKILCFILSLLLTAVYSLGIVYMTGTIDFFSKITDVGGETEDYYVIVRDDSAYKDVDEIQGKTVQTYTSKEINYSEAKNKLKEKENVEYGMSDNLSELANGLIDRTFEIVFISAAHYNTICDEHDTFGDNTRILYTVKIPIESEDISKGVNVTDEAFNIYVSGLDVDGSIDVTSRSDVNMIITVNPKTKEILLTSIPRDYIINLPSKDNAVDKLTHTGIYGIKETVGSVEQMMGIDLNYYVKVNYTTVTKLVDAIGGIDVNSDFTFTTSGMAASGLSGITFYEGENHLDGAKALAFARERHSFTDGDVQRNKNQQKIMKAILKKGTSSRTLLTKYSSILNSIEDNIEINMSGSDIRKLVKMQLADMAKWQIKTQNIKGEGDMALCYSTGEYYVSVMQPDEASIISAVDNIVGIMTGDNE